MAFNEDTRVKIPATIQLLRVGYEYQSLKDADIDVPTKIFRNRFKPALEKINGRPFTEDEIDEVIADILRVIKNHDLGREFYEWLIKPVDKVKLIDFANIANNDFAVVNELVFGLSNEGSFRPDITALINGIPLAFLEVKKPNNEGGIQSEFVRMIYDRFEKEEHKKYFNMLQFIAFSNNMEYETEDTDEDPKAGSFYTTPNGFITSFNFFREEEKEFAELEEIEEEKIRFVLKDNKYNPAEYDTAEFQTNLSTETPCNRFITSVFSPKRLMYFLQYGILFVDDKVPEKHIMRYPQFFASKRIIERLEAGGKGGIIWHTQGSGKTELAAYCNRVIKDYYAKNSINTRFFFVVDRLDLLTQASNEFTVRKFNAINVEDREGFCSELNKVLSTNSDMKSWGDFTVVNIHKIIENMPVAKNDYDAKIQRVFFVDEAHRSYKMTGEYFKNLMLADTDAIFIALTGTPLLNKKERSNFKFGEYIHKYFFDKSIMDGYTLRIKRETIDTLAKAEIKRNLDLENPEVDKDAIYQSDAYITALCKFIQDDFKDFRLVNNDKTIGGMVVCNSNPQAKKVQAWFENNSELNTGLVITDKDISSQYNKNTQLNFKRNLVPDMLVVHQMLTTGYDVKRLKKMYLLRNAREHSLLQTISRVNRPYKNENGKSYKYGYIVDFVDVEAEYERTIKQYIDELEEEIKAEGEEDTTFSGLVIDVNTIYDLYLKLTIELEEIADTSNLEEFAKALVNLDKDKLLNIKRKLIRIKECYTEFLLSREMSYVQQIDIEQIKKMLKIVQNRIDFINLKNKAVDTLAFLSNTEVVNIIYQFIKVKVSIMDLGKYQELPEVEEIVDKIKKIQQGIKCNKHKEDIRIVKLNEFLEKIFNMLEIVDLNDLSKIDAELLKALEEIERINKENERLASVYNGSFAFVKAYVDYCSLYPEYDKADIEAVLVCVQNNVREIMSKNAIIIQGRSNFITNVMQKTTIELLKSKLYKKLNLKEWYSQLIGDIYVNLQIYK